MTTQQQVIQSLPNHLQPFAAVQDYSQYSARDQAVWRFLLRQLKHNLSQSAQPTYREGLEKTGISTESIPRIETINECLNKLGWRAVVVDGFLPPAIFMEFQALRVLVIAVNMRSFEHMLYTPAPDIVHESAGHAPFIIDIDYSEFLQHFGELGMRAIANRADMDVYQAIRKLSIVKESNTTSPAEAKAAEVELEQALAANLKPSESALLARLHWWTVEYGLVGELQNYYIFGAGLLSSLGESVHCLNDKKVKKKPLTVDAIKTSYDITNEQPQLFVTESCRHLSQILEDFGRHMCCNRGGVDAMEEAIEAATVNTAVLNSGIQISGQFSRVIKDAVGNAVYFNTSGATQLSYQAQQLQGHGIDYHREGFGCPVGRLRGFERCLSSYTVDELKRHHIEPGQRIRLDYLSGISVDGTLAELVRRDQKNILLSFENCTVSDADGEILFDPGWGVYDMAVGASIDSLQGGSADKQAFPLYAAPSTQVTITQASDEPTLALFKLYATVRSLREKRGTEEAVRALAGEIGGMADTDWLLIYEMLELSYQYQLDASIRQTLTEKLKSRQSDADDDVATLIQYGLDRFQVPQL